MWRIVTNSDLLEEMQRQTSLLHAIYREQRTIRRLLFLQTKPGKLRLTKKENLMQKNVWDCTVWFPAVPEGTDVVTQRVNVTAGGVIIADDDYPLDVTSLDITVDENAHVHAEVAHVDDAGNVGEAAVLDVDIIDDVAPAKPGEIRLEKRGERIIDVPDPE